MKEIMVINPSNRRKKTTKKKVKSKKKAVKKPKKSVVRKTTKTEVKTIMAKKRGRKKAKKTAITTTTTKRRVYRRNPSNPPRRGRRKSSGKLSFRAAIKNTILMDIGMFAAKFGAKRFGTATASETDPTTWDWMSYIKGGIGAVSLAFLANSIRRGTGQRILDGGLAYIGFKLIENELISKNEKLISWLGEDEPYMYGYGQSDPNVLVLDEDETPYIQGDNGYMLPLDERHRLMGDSLVQPGRLGDVLAVPGRLGADARSAMLQSYSSAWR